MAIESGNRTGDSGDELGMARTPSYVLFIYINRRAEEEEEVQNSRVEKRGDDITAHVAVK